MGFLRQAMTSDRGAILAIGAAGLGAILLVGALVVDLGSARVDRAQNQVVTDAAAAAGIIGLVDSGGVGGCEAALGYVEAHVGPVAGLSCSGFPVDCDAMTLSTSTLGTSGGVTVTITHPVGDNDPMMSAGSTSAAIQDSSEADGDRCDRFGVGIQATRSSFFRAVTAQSVGRTSVHSVARVSDAYGRDLVINLLLLERTECEALSIGGGGSSGGITVSSVTDPETGEVYPGRIALDSNGSGSSCSSRGTIHANGAGATIRADGPPGCANEVEPSGFGMGCGRLETYAPGAPGCNLPACTSGGVITPPPVKSPRRFTRAPIDYLYNCKETYPVSYEIRSCSEASIRTPYIDELSNSVEAYNSFRRYNADSRFPCQINGSSDPIVVPEGNWIVDCPDLRVFRELIFEGGNIIFEGDVTVGAQGSLQINTNNTSTYLWSSTLDMDYTQHSAQAAFVYFEGGTLDKSAGATLEMQNTLVYLSSTSALKLGGGAGSLVWSAPLEGPFTNLALWSESTLDHGFAGSATLVLEGVFFTPLATVVYTGNGGQASIEAQFIANRASAQGNGLLEIAPKWDRIVRFPPPAITELIR